MFVYFKIIVLPGARQFKIIQIPTIQILKKNSKELNSKSNVYVEKVY